MCLPSATVLMRKSTDDELLDKESKELLKDGSDDISLGEEKPTEDSNKNEKAPLPKPIKSPEMDGDIDSLGVNEFEFHDRAFLGEDFHEDVN